MLRVFVAVSLHHLSAPIIHLVPLITLITSSNLPPVNVPHSPHALTCPEMPSDKAKFVSYTPTLVQTWKKKGMGWYQGATLYKDEAQLDAEVLSQLNRNAISLPRVHGWSKKKFRAHIATEIGKELLATNKAVISSADPLCSPHIKVEEGEDEVMPLEFRYPPKPTPQTVERCDWNKIANLPKEMPSKARLSIPHQIDRNHIPSQKNANLTPLGRPRLQILDPLLPKLEPVLWREIDGSIVASGIGKIPAGSATLTHHNIHWSRLTNFTGENIINPINPQPVHEGVRHVSEAQVRYLSTICVNTEAYVSSA
ncbi:hypothetical protein K491DRAFT_686046 [Lophiostoma macrostomum CBS 122681]|uniref:Uncharacterized protein n=1 Tax=Lophiostoma macrostomum CBS 122681 TaxID=1314788 RepID=A0A6A6TTW6_9PLEO|nr:hypothetical protein K491DRAFT_686046 [Lophiostoma macrostomum CBS 122681]